MDEKKTPFRSLSCQNGEKEPSEMPPKVSDDTEGREEGAENPSGPLLMSRIEWLIAYFDRMNFGGYVELLQKPRRLFLLNFFAGIARGFGFAIGFSILGFLAFYILNRLELLNLPIIGDFIAELLRYVEMNKGARV